jgi:hypothetical protein
MTEETDKQILTYNVETDRRNGLQSFGLVAIKMLCCQFLKE